MMDPEWLRNSYVEGGVIDRFGTVRIVYNTPPARRRKGNDIRVYSPVLHRYADGKHHVVAVGATLRILNYEEVVATLSCRQLEPTGPETTAAVLSGGYAVDRALELASAADLEAAAAGHQPVTFNENPFVKVDAAWIGRRLVIFWLDNDYAVAFTPDGKPVPCTVEYPLAQRSWPTP